MAGISPYRIATYLAIAAVLALIGWNSLRAGNAADRTVRVGASGSAINRAERSRNPAEGDGAPAGLEPAAGDRSIVVDVSGAVMRPGVYRFDHGQRVIDAIRRAGGATRGAFAAGLNRAALLSDGQQVVVPARAGDAGVAVAGASGGGPEVGPGAEIPISLGTATKEQLEEIEGIGPVTAQGILEFRDSQGGISSVDELDQVSGIGPVTMEALRSRLQP